MRSIYEFHPKLVLRAPKNPLNSLINKEFNLDHFVNDDSSMEAIYIASHVLHSELIKYRSGKVTSKKELDKLTASAYKYYSRMSSRCTPFGLFSGCATVKWSNENTKVVLSSDHERHTRFDMLYLCSIANQISALPFVKPRLLYFPNNSIYIIGEEMRYVEYKFLGNRRKYIISSVLASPYLIKILEMANNGCKIYTLTNWLIRVEKVSEKEASEFIEELIASQLLVSEMEPSITGDEFLVKIINTLETINQPSEPAITFLKDNLTIVENMMKEIDSKSTNPILVYENLVSVIKQFNISFDISKLFQVDSFLKISDDMVNNAIQEEILDALDIVNLLNNTKPSSNMESFIKKFRDRYEDKEMSLLEVMDNETGIGYLESSSIAVTPLVEDVSVGKKSLDELTLHWKIKDKYLLDKVLEATRNQKEYIELQQSDFTKSTSDWSRLSPSIPISFRLLEGGKILLENTGGSSAVNLLGRFAHGSEEIKHICEEIIEKEVKLNPEVIFAEVVHLPENRTGNVLLHPVFRDYEIPFLTSSTLPPEKQIHLKDLFISIRNGKILLRSARLNKEIIPRISTAHNWHEASALPIYKFFGDLQLQERQQAIIFNWGNLERQIRYLPRVIYRNVILKQAQWSFDKHDISPFVDMKEGYLEKFKEFREKWKLPRFVVIADSDNELLIDFESIKVLNIWIEVVKKRPSFILKEFFLGANENGVRNEKGDFHQNQFLALLVRNTKTYDSSINKDLPNTSPKTNNSFSIGSEWLYFKIYTGVKSADLILTNAIKPILTELLNRKIIKCFFFIRFYDPNFHLRVRFKATDLTYLGDILECVNRHLKQFEEQEYISKIQMDAYSQEIERYGESTIEIAEEFFFLDSVAVLNFLLCTEGDEREAKRWKWALLSIDILLNDFGLSGEEKMNLLEGLKSAFHKEFNTDKIVKDQLKTKYRNNRKDIENLILEDNKGSSLFEDFYEILKSRSEKNSPLVNSLKKVGELEYKQLIAHLLPSYIHMQINRIILERSRLHELVLYDLLYSFYRSQVKRNFGSEIHKDESVISEKEIKVMPC
jgi:thiopeptide-type bacteriocin biosynthesis protein